MSVVTAAEIREARHRQPPQCTCRPRGVCFGRPIAAGLMGVLLFGLVVGEATAQTALLVPVRRQRAAIRTRAAAQDGLITAERPGTGNHAAPNAAPRSENDKLARWTLQTVGEVTLRSPIVRLKDIVLPIGIPAAVWENLGPAAVTLVPTDGRRLTLERQRLLESVQRHLAPQQRVHWTGPELIYVQYKGETRAVRFPQDANAQTSAGSQNTVHKFSSDDVARQSAPPRSTPSVPGAREPIRQASYAQGTDGPARHGCANRSTDDRRRSQDIVLPVREVKRLTRLIESAIASQWPEVEEMFALEVDSEYAGLRDLHSLRHVEGLRLNEPIRPGSQLIQISGTTIDGSVTAEIRLQASPRPEGVFVRTNIRRGERLQQSDLERRRLTRSQEAEGLVAQIEPIVGMEARTTLHVDRPIRRDDLRPPTVIHRGDLVELRVAGGGITVRSNAKALSDGAVGELIEVETERPRKRLMASVVDIGQVEVLTRAPQLAR